MAGRFVCSGPRKYSAKTEKFLEDTMNSMIPDIEKAVGYSLDSAADSVTSSATSIRNSGFSLRGSGGILAVAGAIAGFGLAKASHHRHRDDYYY